MRNGVKFLDDERQAPIRDELGDNEAQDPKEKDRDRATVHDALAVSSTARR